MIFQPDMTSTTNKNWLPKFDLEPAFHSLSSFYEAKMGHFWRPFALAHHAAPLSDLHFLKAWYVAFKSIWVSRCANVRITIKLGTMTHSCILSMRSWVRIQQRKEIFLKFRGYRHDKHIDLYSLKCFDQIDISNFCSISKKT